MKLRLFVYRSVWPLRFCRRVLRPQWDSVAMLVALVSILLLSPPKTLCPFLYVFLSFYQDSIFVKTIEWHKRIGLKGTIFLMLISLIVNYGVFLGCRWWSGTTLEEAWEEGFHYQGKIITLPIWRIVGHYQDSSIWCC